MNTTALDRFRFAVGDALRQKDVARAMMLSEQAVTQGIEDQHLLTLAGQFRLRNNQLDRAFDVFTRASKMAPDNIEALNGLGLCHSMMGRPHEAIAMFEAAIARAPATAYLHLHLAQPLEDVGRLRDAQAALERVLAAEPMNVNALCRLANLCARRGDTAGARRHAMRALSQGPQVPATIALTMAEIADGRYEKARALIAPVAATPQVGPVSQSIAQGLLGDALDALERPAEAFAAYTRAREVLREPFAPVFAGQESAIARVRRLTEFFRGTAIEPWQADPAAPAGPVGTHVFLVGFPRSGTTLLEQALASHGEVRTMEEVDCLGDTAGEFFFAQDGMARFAALGEEELSRLRTFYWQRVADGGAQTDRAVFVDKMPLNSVHLGLVSRLFPSARILFALRDPRDVVLSCFRRRLVMSAHMYELSRLDGAAQFYAAVMALAEVYRERLGLPTLELRHEDMLADFDGEMRRVCDFLGIGWDASVRDFAIHARDRDVKTPSAMQIVRGLNKDGAGQWRRFAEQMKPVLPILRPWVERFGYED